MMCGKWAEPQGRRLSTDLWAAAMAARRGPLAAVAGVVSGTITPWSMAKRRTTRRQPGPHEVAGGGTQLARGQHVVINGDLESGGFLPSKRDDGDI
jgi:ApbE superfamily uncharacterized protein (UPF0280 family)